MVKKKTEEELQIYGVYIFRKDQEHLTILESTNFEECFKAWEELQLKWTEAVKEVKPFVLKDPVLTAFEPGLIYEIMLRPIMKQTASINTNNPYARQMLTHGFGNTFGNEDLLSRVTRNDY